MPSTVLLASLLVSVASTLAASIPLLEKYGFPSNPFGATAFAFLYGEPLLYYKQEFNGSFGLSVLGTNNFFLSNNGYLANASFDEVINPNVDTLYGLTVLDFSEQDVEIYLPVYERDRVVIVDIWDPYGSCLGSVSSILSSTPGTYLLRPNLEGTPSANRTCDKKYQACMDSPTLDATLVVRVEVKNNGTDEDYARSYINNFTVASVNKHAQTANPLAPSDFEGLSSNPTLATLDLLARLAQRNPPQTKEYAEAVPSILEMAGICNGRYSPVPGVDVDAAYRLFNTTVTNYSTTPASITVQNNGWSIINPSIQAGFEHGTALLGRNYWGSVLYLGNLPDTAVYPMPEENKFSLGTNESLIATFHSKPQIGSPGLWSLTAYDLEGYLVSNPLDVYEVGDRSNLTYADGMLLYPTKAENISHDDGPFQILMQRSSIYPPSNWTQNWLPVPDSDQNFTLTFRVYNPHNSMKNGEYQYPTLTRQAALVGSS